MKFFHRQKIEKNRIQVESDTIAHREPEGHVHPNYRHWVYLRRSNDLHR